MNREERRSLLLHRHIAERLMGDPEPVIAKARVNLEKMRRLHPAAADTFDQWQRILRGSPEEIVRVLTSTDQASLELRHVTPFAGVLDARERART